MSRCRSGALCALLLAGFSSGCVSKGDTNYDSRKFSGSGPCVDFCNLSVDEDCNTTPDCVEQCLALLDEVPACHAAGEDWVRCIVGAEVACDVSGDLVAAGCSVEQEAFFACYSPGPETCQAAADCFSCCQATLPEAYAPFEQYFSDCVCQSACGEPACSQVCSGASDQIEGECSTCFDDQGTTCIESASLACQTSPACRPFNQCWASCP